MTIISFVILFATGAWGLIKCLIIKGKLESTLKDANITALEFYSSIPLQIILYRDPKSKEINPEGESIIKNYIHAEIISIMAFSLSVILLAITK